MTDTAAHSRPAAETTSDTDLRAFNLGRANKLYRLAWTIEIVLVTVGIGVAVAQAFGYQSGQGALMAVPIFGVFVVLAAVELAKIPAATVVFHASGWRRGLALAGLLVASLISFETVFNSFERYVHVTTHAVSEARAEHAEILGDIAQLSDMALSEGLVGEDVARVDAERLEQLKQALALRESALEAARRDLESPETRELKAQLASLLEQQETAGREAGDAWQAEQEWIMARLDTDAIDDATRRQLNNRMRSMPAKQNVIAAARAPFEDEILKLNAAVEQSITEPSQEVLDTIAAKQADRDTAAQTLADFEAQAAERANDRTLRLIDIEQAEAQRAEMIEVLETQAVDKQREIARRAENSQMHRWASFFFGVETAQVEDNQAKLVGAVFGVFLGIVAALTGSSVAMYSEWYRVRGVRPVIRQETVEVEVIVEKEVEKPVEVEVPVLRTVYVPVPMGEEADKVLNEILEGLPSEVAEDLRRELSQGANKTEPTPEPELGTAPSDDDNPEERPSDAETNVQAEAQAAPQATQDPAPPALPPDSGSEPQSDAVDETAIPQDPTHKGDDHARAA